jgi:hypothetical protein
MLRHRGHYKPIQIVAIMTAASTKGVSDNFGNARAVEDNSSSARMWRKIWIRFGRRRVGLMPENPVEWIGCVG